MGRLANALIGAAGETLVSASAEVAAARKAERLAAIREQYAQADHERRVDLERMRQSHNMANSAYEDQLIRKRTPPDTLETAGGIMQWDSGANAYSPLIVGGEPAMPYEKPGTTRKYMDPVIKAQLDTYQSLITSDPPFDEAAAAQRTAEIAALRSSLAQSGVLPAMEAKGNEQEITDDDIAATANMITRYAAAGVPMDRLKAKIAHLPETTQAKILGMVNVPRSEDAPNTSGPERGDEATTSPSGGPSLSDKTGAAVGAGGKIVSDSVSSMSEAFTRAGGFEKNGNGEWVWTGNAGQGKNNKGKGETKNLKTRAENNSADTVEVTIQNVMDALRNKKIAPNKAVEIFETVKLSLSDEAQKALLDDIIKQLKESSAPKPLISAGQ